MSKLDRALANVLYLQFPTAPQLQLDYAAGCVRAFLKDNLHEHGDELGLWPEIVMGERDGVYTSKKRWVSRWRGDSRLKDH